MPTVPSSLRPGRRAARVATTAAYAGGVALSLGATGWGLLVGEAKLARRAIGTPQGVPPAASGSYGHGRRGRRPLRVALLGDSSAAGLGTTTSQETPGALLAGMLASEMGRRVRLDVYAVVGARSADLDMQVARALQDRVDLAVILIGANDVTHRVSPSAAARDLGRAVRTLREARAAVVVGTCPDFGVVQPLRPPLRTVARRWSRRLAQEQAVAVVEADGVAVSLGDLLAPEFARSAHYWSPDRFHPSSAGYRRMVDVLLPSALTVLGVDLPGSDTVRDSVQDVELAAAVAARTPGLEVETVPGREGAATAGPGRLARLRRRLPLVGGGDPAPRNPDDDLPADG